MLILGGCEDAKSEGKAQAKRVVAGAEAIAGRIAAWVDMSRDDRAAIDCAWGAGMALAPVCKVEWLDGQDRSGFMLMVSRPDGGFRRLLVSEDGAIAAADGAEAAHIGDGLVVTVGAERYRLTTEALR